MGGVLGLVAPAVVLTLFSVYGVWQIMFRHTDLRTVFWPSSVMMITGWCCTVPGVLITISSAAINVVLYAFVAVAIRSCLRFVAGRT